MRETREAQGCGRAEQLLGYLYGEATADERAGFERHLPRCAACRDELAAFGQLRTTVGDWHARLLQTAPALDLDDLTARHAHAQTPAAPTQTAATAATIATTVRTGVRTDMRTETTTETRADASRRRSARAAFREFFALAPVWLRAASVAAALLLCTLAALAVFDAARGASAPAVQAVNGRHDGAQHQQALSPNAQPARLDELEAELEAARRELEETRAQLDDSRAANIEAAVFAEDETPAAPPAAHESTRTRRTHAPARRNAPARRGASNLRDEENLPRLLDLLGDANGD